MPIYEFRCNRCRDRSSVFTRSISASISPICPHCGSTDLSRLISRVAVIHSEEELAAGLDDSSLAEVDEDDPRSMARWVRRMSRQMGEPLNAEMEADLDRMEMGEMPEELAQEDSDDIFDEE